MLAINQKNRRLPGFRFEAFAPAREDVLPRMDIVLFVGFASTGPVGIPVAVESAEQFKAIFGNDLPLVWDREKGEVLHAFLAPTVRAFFRNGGKRCWILRVARVEPSVENPLNCARYNFFPLNGFGCARLDQKEIVGISPAFARARSRGSWSDELQLGTAILSKAVKLSDFDGTEVEKQVTLEIGAGESVSTGDLFRFTFEGENDENLILLLAVDDIKEAEKIQAAAPQNMPSFGKRIVEFTSKHFVWLKKLSAKTFAGKKNKVQVSLWTRQQNADSESAAETFVSESPAVFVFEEPKDNSSQPKARLIFSSLAAADAPAVGSLLFTKLNKELIGLQVETIIFGSGEKADETEIVCQAITCRRNIIPTGKVLQAERLTFEFWIKKDRQTFIKLSDLAFNAGHRRFWGNLPTDEDWYHFFHETDKNPPAWTQNAETSNFPLAGSDESEGFYFPMFAAALPENYLGALLLSGTQLQRDGLEVFDEELFLDPKLKNTGTGNLLNEAEFIRYLSPRPRALWGIHSALVPETVSKIAAESEPTNLLYTNYSLDECTIIAVPDAIHRGWSKTSKKERDMSPPVLPTPIFSPPLRPEWWHFQDCRNADMKRVSEPPAGQFLDCGIRFVNAPHNLRVMEKDISSGKFTIAWDSKETDKDIKFVLEESPAPEFEFPAEIFSDAGKQFEVLKHRAGVYFYRVRAEIGRNFSDWSNGLGVRIPETEGWSVNAEYKPDVLLAVQRALLRMCAARGDLFAVLNLPEQLEEKDAFAHVGTLKTTKGLTAATGRVEPLSADETRVLSFGAMYHPWLLTHEEDFEGFRNIPPDGAICGTFARRADERGAWIAPANERLQGVLGLAKDVRRERFQDFQDNLINLIRQEPRGFLVLDSDTLSGDADLRSVNVRRLLSLLRRLAVRHGAEYVFEPNNESFRRQVRRGFEAMLDLMFTRGAFAGKTPANSYQVVVSNAVNNPRSVEQGLFIVELRVAPSLPLKFVTVRLVQAGARSNVIEVF